MTRGSTAAARLQHGDGRRSGSDGSRLPSRWQLLLLFSSDRQDPTVDLVPQLVRFEIPLPIEPTFTAGAGIPVVSPDGQYVAFGANGPSPIWIRALGTTESQRLPGTEGATDPFWSADSRSLAFTSQGTLKRVDISGGVPQIICDAPPGGAGATWNSDGTIIFAGATGGLWRVRAAGGEPVQVTTPDAARKEVSHRWPHFLPDGRRFLYLALPGNTVYLRSLDSKESMSLAHRRVERDLCRPGLSLVFSARVSALATIRSHKVS